MVHALNLRLRGAVTFSDPQDALRDQRAVKRDNLH